MELLVELVVEVVGQFLFEVVVEAGFRGVGRVLSNRVVRFVLGATATLGLGVGGGYWWGARLSELGRTDPPSSLWVSIALAAVFVTLALARALGSSGEREGAPEGLRDRLTPWRWSPERLLGFAAINGSVAIGMALGFTPRALG